MPTKKNTGKKTTSIKKEPVKSKAINPLILIAVFISALTLVLFWHSDQGQFLNWDDNEYILNNLSIRDFSWHGMVNIFSTFQVANYHPLTTFTWVFEYNLYGLNPVPYHRFNVILHVINTLLVLYLVFKLTKSVWPAAITALFFAIHPMHVESVAWVAERKDVLYTVFFLSALIAYLKYLSDPSKLKWYFIALGLFLLSLLSKSAAVVLPLLLLLFDYYNSRKFNKKTLLEKTPFFLLSLAFGITAYYAQRSVGAMNSMADYNFADRIFFVIYGFCFYLISAIAPLQLSAVHFYPEKNSGLLPWIYYASPVLLLAIGFLIYKAKAFRKELIFGFLFFLINIILVLQIIPLGRSMVSERYTYVPYIGIFLIFGMWWTKYFSKGSSRIKTIKNSFAIFFVGLAILFSVISWNRIAVWKNSESLFRDVINKYPRSYFGYYYTAFALYEDGKYKEALPLFDQSIEYNADNNDAWNNRANCKYFLKDYDGAFKDYNEAIRIFPEFASAYHNRGSCYATLNKYPEAIADYSLAIKYNPKYIEAYYNRGLVYNLDKQYEKAIVDFTSCIELNPNMGKAYYDRGASKINLNRISEGCTDMQQALYLGFDKASAVIQQYCGSGK
jgi:protein O-mannosyl-transferase